MLGQGRRWRSRLPPGPAYGEVQSHSVRRRHPAFLVPCAGSFADPELNRDGAVGRGAHRHRGPPKRSGARSALRRSSTASFGQFAIGLRKVQGRTRRKRGAPRPSRPSRTAPAIDPAKKVGMGNAPEVVREVGVHHVRMAAKQQLLHLDHRLTVFGAARRPQGRRRARLGARRGSTSRMSANGVKHAALNARPRVSSRALSDHGRQALETGGD